VYVRELATTAERAVTDAGDLTDRIHGGLLLYATPFATTAIPCEGRLLGQHSGGDAIHADWGAAGIVYEVRYPSTSALRFVSENGENWPLALELEGSHPTWAENLAL